MEGWQNQGYGTKLVRFIHEHSTTLGCRKMFLITNKHNASACRCYEKAGGICNAAFDPGFPDHITMSLRSEVLPAKA